MDRRVGAGNVYLVGDAAGQVKVSTVGGTVTGLRGAQAVALAILGQRARPHRFWLISSSLIDMLSTSHGEESTTSAASALPAATSTTGRSVPRPTGRP